MEILDRPDRPTGAGLVLTHGAGANSRAPLLLKVAEAFTLAGLYVLRFDLPFRQRRPFGPPSPATAAADRAGLRDAVARLRETATGPIFLGGHSYGGRQATMLAAEDPGVAAGLLLLSYPLHPPGKPERMRTEHFPALLTPAVFVHGSRDDFGSIEEMRQALQLIPAPAQLVEIEGAGHDLKLGAFDLAALVVPRLTPPAP